MELAQNSAQFRRQPVNLLTNLMDQRFIEFACFTRARSTGRTSGAALTTPRASALLHVTCMILSTGRSGAALAHRAPRQRKKILWLACFTLQPLHWWVLPSPPFEFACFTRARWCRPHRTPRAYVPVPFGLHALLTLCMNLSTGRSSGAALAAQRQTCASGRHRAGGVPRGMHASLCPCVL